jgi:hypothetical protein
MHDKPLVFISHIAEESEMAILIKDKIIEENLLGSVEVFVSSDKRVNTGGQSWLKNIENALQKASVFLILTSPNSVKRPWINIEAGAGWLRQLQSYKSTNDQIYVMPLCHSGQKVSTLPKPWDTLNAIECSTVSGLQEILNIVGNAAHLTKIPRPNFDHVIGNLKMLEFKYSYLNRIENSINLIIEFFPDFRQVFLCQIPQGEFLMLKDQQMHEVDSLFREIQYLESEGLLKSQKSGSKNKTVLGPNNSIQSSVTVDFGLNVTPKYVNEIFKTINLIFK